MGLVLNRPTDTSVDDALPDLVPLTGTGEPVYVGGPVALESVLAVAELDDPDDSSELLFGAVGFVQEPDVPVLRGRVFVGYAGWSAGQLEAELEEESWLVIPAETDDLFSTTPTASGAPSSAARAVRTPSSRSCRRIHPSTKLAVGTRMEGGPMEEGRKTRRAPLLVALAGVHPARGDVGDHGARRRLDAGCKAGQGQGDARPDLEGSARKLRRQVRRRPLSVRGRTRVERPLTARSPVSAGLRSWRGLPKTPEGAAVAAQERGSR